VQYSILAIGEVKAAAIAAISFTIVRICIQAGTTSIKVTCSGMVMHKTKTLNQRLNRRPLYRFRMKMYSFSRAFKNRADLDARTDARSGLFLFLGQLSI
jgi:hypothetical protein